MRLSKLALMLAGLSALALSGPVLAAPKNGSSSSHSMSLNCWGVVSAQLAQVEGGIGEHSSSQDTPRLGLGNVARVFFELGLIDDLHVSSLGSLLAQLDEYDETACPIR